jgi:hypothetical protein
MVRRKWWLLGLALMMTGSSGCGLFCERYCERERDRCQGYNQNRGCCAPAAPAPQCGPGCAPVAGPYCGP